MRGYIWSRSLPLLRNTILVGYGPDTFAMNFPQHDIAGKVKAYPKGKPSEAIELKPGQAASYVSSKDIITITSPEPNYAAWNTHKFQFNNTSLDEIIALIESVYSIHIDLSSPELGSCKLTATFENQSPESILQVIASALHLKLGGDDTSFILSGMPCQSNK